MFVLFLICILNGVLSSTLKESYSIYIPYELPARQTSLDTKQNDIHLTKPFHFMHDAPYAKTHSKLKAIKSKDNLITSIEVERNLIASLKELNRVLTKILQTLKFKKNFKPLHDVVGTSFNKGRRKRGINDDVVADSDRDIIKTDVVTNATQAIDLNASNLTKTVEDLDDRNETTREGNGRRTMSVIDSVIKKRLLHYIYETFNEIKTKIDTLERIKELYANDVNFRMGYIVASLDTLSINMNNMKDEMDKHKLLWNDKKVLDIYDIVRVSNTAISRLLEVLKSYVGTPVK